MSIYCSNCKTKIHFDNNSIIPNYLCIPGLYGILGNIKTYDTKYFCSSMCFDNGLEFNRKEDIKIYLNEWALFKDWI